MAETVGMAQHIKEESFTSDMPENLPSPEPTGLPI